MKGTLGKMLEQARLEQRLETNSEKGQKGSNVQKGKINHKLEKSLK